MGCSELGERKHLGIYNGGFVMAIVWQCLNVKALHIKYSKKYTWLNNCMQLKFVRFRHPAKQVEFSRRDVASGKHGRKYCKESHQSGAKYHISWYASPTLSSIKTNDWIPPTSLTLPLKKKTSQTKKVIFQSSFFKGELLNFLRGCKNSHRIHVWYIYLHLP